MGRPFILNSNYLPDPFISNLSDYSYTFISREKDLAINVADDFIFSKGSFNPIFDKIGVVTDKVILRTLPPSREDLARNESLKKRGLKPLAPEIEWQLKVKMNRDLKKKQSFNNLVYSLLFIENYSNPISHIQQKTRFIPSFDFETIELGLVYISRTAFGKFMNALPIDNRYEMRQILSEIRRREKIEKIDFLRITEILIEYINVNFINQGRLLIESSNILSKRFSEIEDKFGLVDPTYSAEKSIARQARLFEQLLKTDLLKFLSDILETAKKESLNENRFEEKFGERRLPISLN